VTFEELQSGREEGDAPPEHPVGGAAASRCNQRQNELRFCLGFVGISLVDDAGVVVGGGHGINISLPVAPVAPVAAAAAAAAAAPDLAAAAAAAAAAVHVVDGTAVDSVVVADDAVVGVVGGIADDAAVEDEDIHNVDC